VGKASESITAVPKITRKRAILEDVSNHAAKTTVASNALNGKTIGVKASVPLRQKPLNRTTKSDGPGALEKRKPDANVSISSRLSKQECIVTEPPTKQRKTSISVPEVDLDLEEKAVEHERPLAVVEVVQDWDDLDAADQDDPLMVSEYVVEIFNYLREQELVTLPTPDYMDRQKDLHWKMRGILVDWLVEVHQKFRLLPETLFLAVNIIDRFLSLRVCSLPKLQLVGITALFIASKYEEVLCPQIQNFIYMADGGYTDDEILKAEQYVSYTRFFQGIIVLI